GPAWIPDDDGIKSSNIYQLMSEIKISKLKAFHTWTTHHYAAFWGKMIDKLHIIFHEPPNRICNLSKGIETPDWLEGAKLNIANSCFNAPPDKHAIIYQNNQNEIETLSYAKLDQLSNQVANSLIKFGFKKNDAIAIHMPMNQYAIAIYIGIIKMGGIVVSIADSFSAEEVGIRIRSTETKAIFTQDFIKRDTKKSSLYEKMIGAK